MFLKHPTFTELDLFSKLKIYSHNNHFWTLRWHRWLKSFLVEDRTMLLSNRQHYVCWWANDPRALQWRHNGCDGVSKSPASRLFTQPFIQAQITESIKAPRHLAFVRGIHRWPVNFPHKRPVTRKMFPFDDVIMARGSATMVLTGFFALFQSQ